MIKVVIHLKSGNKLAYSSHASEQEIKDFWFSALKDGDAGVVQFGRFVASKPEVSYVEIQPH